MSDTDIDPFKTVKREGVAKIMPDKSLDRVRAELTKLLHECDHEVEKE